MTLTIRIHTNSIFIPDRISPIHTFDGEISDILFEKGRVFFLISNIYKDSFTIERFANPDNVYCFDLDGVLLWQKGKMEFTYYGGNKIVHGADSFFMNDGLLKICYQSDYCRWLNPDTGEMVKEEWYSGK